MVLFIVKVIFAVKEVFENYMKSQNLESKKVDKVLGFFYFFGEVNVVVFVFVKKYQNKTGLGDALVQRFGGFI